MQVCKRMIVGSLGIILSAFLWGEEAPSPKMPSMPSMPEVSAPVLGGSFYKPSFPSKKSQTANSKNNQASNSSSSNETVLSDGTTGEDLLTSLISGNTNLSALDISSLYDSGLFSNISSLRGTKLSTNNQATSTNVLLQQVLTSLDELKAQQKNASVVEQQALKATQKDSENFKNREPSILRFKINGYDIADSLTTVFFSDTENDGSFLLTGDRKYYADQKPRTETFYLLFKTIKNKGSSVTYEVQPRIVQDLKNENSYVYKMTHLKNLTAEKTGNLVVLHSSNDNLNVDLLLDIDQKY